MEEYFHDLRGRKSSLQTQKALVIKEKIDI